MADTVPPIAAALLTWYDRNARTLPWRTPHPDPYRVWLSEIMLQQTTTAAVAPYYARFLERWPTIAALARADDATVMSAWAGLGYYARARNLLACARHVAGTLGGRFPDTEDALRALPGIGPYTAAAIAAIAFGRRAVVVDGNVERVVSRLFAIDTPLPNSRPLIRARTDEITPDTRSGDFAQAMMDLGATICTPTRPACILCPLTAFCQARGAGRQDELPRKLQKAVRPQRFGQAFVVTRADGAVLVRTRPGRGLLGGMTEFPGTWPTDDLCEMPLDAPVRANWRPCGTARHGFTHFDLALTVFRGEADAPPDVSESLRWVQPTDLADEAFPTLMRRVATTADFDLPNVQGSRSKFSASGAREPAPAHPAAAPSGSPRLPLPAGRRTRIR